MTTDVTQGAAGLPVLLSPADLAVLSVIAMWPCPPTPTLDGVAAALPWLPRPDVFGSVARLEDRRLLRWGVVR